MKFQQYENELVRYSQTDFVNNLLNYVHIHHKENETARNYRY